MGVDVGKKSMLEGRRKLAVASGQGVPKGQNKFLLIRVPYLAERVARRTLGDLLSCSGLGGCSERVFRTLQTFSKMHLQTAEQDI